MLGQVRLGRHDRHHRVRALGIATHLLLAHAATPASTEVAAVRDGAQGVLDSAEAVDLGEGDIPRLVQGSPERGGGISLHLAKEEGPAAWRPSVPSNKV